MSGYAASLLVVFAVGFGAGLWAGFKLWRETYVAGIPRRRRFWR